MIPALQHVRLATMLIILQEPAYPVPLFVLLVLQPPFVPLVSTVPTNSILASAPSFIVYQVNT